MTPEPPTLEELNQNMPPNRDGIILLLEEKGEKKTFISKDGKWSESLAYLSERYLHRPTKRYPAGLTPEQVKLITE